MGRKGETRVPSLIAILGPTAVGKSALASRLCQEFQGEIVSADSRQIYRGMDIGTAKPTEEERETVPYHLVDIVALDQTFTLVDYLEKAYSVIGDIIARKRVPFVVGGTGLYVKALTEGYSVPRVAPDIAHRESLFCEAREKGPEELHRRLRKVDPEAASRIDPHNVRRMVRALEIYHATGCPVSQLQTKSPPWYRILRIGLTMDRGLLYRRIDERVDHMLQEGLLDEVKRLAGRYGLDVPAMSGLGYRQLGLYLKGNLSLDEAVGMIKSETHRFVREQYKWFRLSDRDIRWIEVDGDPYPQAARLVGEFLLAD